MDDEKYVEDHILALAKRIAARRLAVKQLQSVPPDKVTIRWDVPGAPFGQSYVGIEVDTDKVRLVIEEHFAEMVKPVALPKVTFDE